MKSRCFWQLGHVSDVELRGDLLGLLSGGARTEARIVAHLAEVEERRLYAWEGCSSMFDYCLSRLGLSESEAFHRITAARLARRFPILFEKLEQRELHLTGVCLLRDHLTSENHAELVAEASHKTKLQIKELLARRFPRPEMAASIRALPTHSGASAGRPALASVEPVSVGRYRLQVDMSDSMREKLELARGLLSHAVPSRDLAMVLERALDALIEKTQKRRFAQLDSSPNSPAPIATRVAPRKEVAVEPGTGATAARAVRSGAQVSSQDATLRAPRTDARASHGRREHIRNADKREIIARDGMRCSFLSEAGDRCESTALLQIHHEVPWARGGSSTPHNLRMLCASHNALLAERDFGRAFVVSRRAERATTSSGSGRSRT